MKQSSAIQTAAIRRMLKHHGRLCTHFVYSDPDRMNKCSCGRDAALVELAALEARVSEFSNSDFCQFISTKNR